MLRFGFVTCVRLGLSCMEAIYDAGGRLATVLTLHDDIAPAKSGRVHADEFCRAHAIPLVKIRNINDVDALAAITAADLDWLFIIGWSQIARAGVLASTRKGVLGMHPTLLPVGRGRAAVPWAILHGLQETGVTLFKLDAGVDTGPIAAQVRIPLAARENAGDLYARVERAHRELILTNWQALAEDRLPLVAQDESRASVWPGRSPEQGRLDPSMTVAEADRLVRAVTRPYPGAFLDVGQRRLRVWAAEPVIGGTNEALRFRDGWLAPTDSEWEPLA
jgi:methionyl-tRNA formyltransferase